VGMGCVGSICGDGICEDSIDVHGISMYSRAVHRTIYSIQSYCYGVLTVMG
jgi:hypothetical protein